MSVRTILGVAALTFLVPLGACQSGTAPVGSEPRPVPAIASASKPSAPPLAPPAVAAVAPAAAAAPAASAGRSIVAVTDRSLVCMVNDRFMGRPQIPVEVAGRTYYGCCAMCKGRLARDAAARTATDPVSGHPVDKAQSFIGQREDGSIVYFESEANLRAFAAAGSKG